MIEGKRGAVHTPQTSEKERVYNQIYKDFYLSFRHSQGNIGLQEDIMTFLIGYYDLNFPQELLGTSRDIENMLRKKSASFRVPTVHIGRTDKEVTRGINEAIGSFVFLYDEKDKREPRLKPPILLEQIYRQIIERDFKYLHSVSSKGRPNRHSDQNPRESFFRTFVVEGKTTSSQALDAMYLEIRKMFGLDQGKLTIPESLLPKGQVTFKEIFEMYVRWWEKVHPGENFLII